MRHLVLLLLLPALLLAQPNPWDPVLRIAPGRKIEVRTRTGEKLSGSIESASAGAVVLRSRRATRSIPKEDVASLSLVIGKSRGAKAAIASGVTGGVLATMVGISCAANHGCEEGTEGVLISIPGTAAIAAGIAALFPPHREVVYSAAPGAK